MYIVQSSSAAFLMQSAPMLSTSQWELRIGIVPSLFADSSGAGATRLSNPLIIRNLVVRKNPCRVAVRVPCRTHNPVLAVMWGNHRIASANPSRIINDQRMFCVPDR